MATPTTIRLRVLPVLPIPFVVTARGSRYIFDPDCDVEKSYAEALLKTYPERFAKPAGDADLNQYTWSKEFQETTMRIVLQDLDEESRLRVYHFAVKTLDAQVERKKKAEEKAAVEAAKRKVEEFKRQEQAQENKP